MKLAGYNSPFGKAVTASEFEKEAGANYKEKGVFPYCFACKETVYTKGTQSPNINGHYAHYRYSDDVDPMDYCVESSQGQASHRLLGLHTEHWDIYRAEKLRWLFFEPDNVKSAYCFCLRACGKGNFPITKFAELIKRADNKNIWAYKNIPVWVVPYILLLLADFLFADRFEFRFVLNKPSRLPLQNLWADDKYSITKIFTDSQREMADGQISINQDTFKRLSGNTNWMDDGFVERLIALA
ncbi:hypothetical protein [Enterovibrio nigricans]|uniref:Uncharacterized protein n=1 Tax=Enterovibrio nigricans DSM 22720 TaxID=1121868 RepID=A0A1T4V8K9_9GAMM|nr:hypothetical protein [Enterovibrio nigricans]PKF50224.1 hypothetical protein AT251_12975 [Enterovibrio nigricans]SKA61289.1 hypothetical protein SAMN02745132_03459 [Enterovibrio nigricans DSM 22720]